MWLLQRAWFPLPFSALVLSSSRGASKRISSAATRITTPMRSPSWISGGSGRGDDGFPPSAVRQLGRERGLSLSSSSGDPIVQRISDELYSARGDLEAHAVRGADSPVISKVLRLMDELEPRALGMTESDFEGLDRSLCIPVVIADSFSQEAFEITVFIIPEGGQIPLHDHPHMTVLSKILFGGLHVESYDLVPPRASGGGGEEERTGGMLSLARSAAARAWTTLAGCSDRRHEAVSIPPREVIAASPSFMLTPSKGNVHAFKAPMTCAVFDILIPPYDSDRGRNCTYYRVETPSPPGNPTPRRNDTAAEGAGGHRQGEEDSRRVVLQEIPEPQGLPRWSEYHGPVVTLR